MSASPEFEQAARQDYGPTTSSENIFEHLSDHKLTNTMSVPSIRTPMLRAVSISPCDDPEPDSTNPESLNVATTSKLDKEVEYHIAEKPCDVEMSVDTLAGIVRIEEATIDNAGRIAYPLAVGEDEAALLQPLVQGVAKLPQNFTINMDGATVSVGDAAAPALWLPTLLAAPAPSPATPDAPLAPPAQIIITSESYAAEPAAAPQPRYLARSKPSKVQILSNISIPKNTYTTQFQTSKEITTPLYAAPNHVYKLNASVVSHKHFNNSVLNSKTPKTQSLIGCSTLPVAAGPAKGASYAHTYTKGGNLNKSLNKVNNGATLNAAGGAGGAGAGAQCHILSRVVAGPNKLSVHTGAPSRKAVNAFKGSKNGAGALPGNQKQSRAIKIIQQTGSSHKPDGKTWPVASVAYKSQQPAYGAEANSSKVIQKVGSPPHKNQHSMNLQKMASKGERLILQSPCGPVLLSTAPLGAAAAGALPRAPHYVQAGPTPNLRYVHTYSAAQPPPAPAPPAPPGPQAAANQQLTAQILQSLAQPKMLLHPAPAPPAPSFALHELHAPRNHNNNQKRIVFGDPSTLLTADDIIGMEERPNLSEELRRYSYQALAIIMLDHTYSQPVQKQPPPAAPAPPPAPAPRQPSPLRAPSPAPLALALSPAPVAPAPAAPPAAPDDDAASLISSLDGEEGARPHSAGSDTETAPEGEDEGRTRCVCDFTHDDGYMICCDRCGEWQHVDCMGIDRNNIPDAYLCAPCEPRYVDRRHARAIQLRKREELHALARAGDAPRRRLLTVTTYCDTSGGQLTTYNTQAPLPPPPAPPAAPPPPAKRPVKRLKKPEAARKAKRKLTEKRVKRKKDMLMTRNKYAASSVGQAPWQESYESAVTNHYSPELRAKMMKYSAKGGNGGGTAAAVGAHLCTTVPHAGGKILIATRDLREATPIIELRGKYMLASQHRAGAPRPAAGPPPPAHKPGPFVFFYRLPRDPVQVCIDTRTYGNEARFVRRSCRPNAELQHCILKGALHVYLVTTTPVPSNTEITVPHDAAPGGGGGGGGGKQPCACGNPKHCKLNGLSAAAARRALDCPPREKRARNRCSSSSSPASPPPAPAPIALPAPPERDAPVTPTTPVKETVPTHVKSEKKSPIKREFEPMSPVKNLLSALNFDKPLKMDEIKLYVPKDEIKDEPMQPFDLLAREEMKPDLDEPDCAPPATAPLPQIEEPTPLSDEKEEIKEPVIENPIEPKVEPVVEPKSEENDIKMEESIFSDEEKTEVPQKVEEVKEKVEEEVKEIKEARRESQEEEVEKIVREVAARAACHDRSARSSRSAAAATPAASAPATPAPTCTNQDSLDDKTDDSQDKLPPANTKEKKKMTREERKMEAIMKAFERMEKAQQRKQEVKERQKRRESDPHPHAAEKEDDDDHCSTKKRRKRKGRARTTSQSNRRRLNSADSDLMTSGDEAPPPPQPPPPHPPGIMSPKPPSRRNSQLQQENRNETVNEDISLSSACLLVEAAVGSVESAFKLPKTKKTMANEWLGRSPERTPSPYRSPYRPPLVPATSLESLVRVASTMIGDLIGGSEQEEDHLQSPPRTPGKDRSKFPKKFRRVTRSTPPTEVVEPPPPPQHSAKKRWLRQAISEESDSPTPESPPSEMVTPLKKRRLARESICYEQSAQPQCNDETSPHPTSEDSPVKEEPVIGSGVVRAGKVRSLLDNLYRSRSRSDSGPGSPEPADAEVLPTDTENIRRIIGVPEAPHPPPAVTRIEDISLNNNVADDKPEPEPMDIDTTVPPPAALATPAAPASADTSGNSSPPSPPAPRDEMDDIQKKIHSFHTENIQILKSRNKKPPKEKRKKVNLNFDLNMVDDQISIQLRTEDEAKSPELNGDVHEEYSLENIPMPSVPPELIPLPAESPPPLQPPEAISLHDPGTIPLPAESPPPPEAIPLPDPGTIPLPAESPPPRAPPEAIALPAAPAAGLPASPPSEGDCGPPEPAPALALPDKPSILEGSTLSFSSRFSTTGLFSGIFSNISSLGQQPEPQINDNVPSMQLIKSALGSSALEPTESAPSDDLRSVHEILSRVNNMDSNNSVLLSDVLRGAGPSPGAPAGLPAAGAGGSPMRRADPRLHPPPADKPKPVRRKLSISEYRKRLKAPASSDSEGAGGPTGPGGGCGGPGQWSPGSGGGSLSPLRLDSSQEDLEARLNKALGGAKPLECVFDAQPTASERQREKLSSRLRREFGLALPDDDDAPPAAVPPPNDGER